MRNQSELNSSARTRTHVVQRKKKERKVRRAASETRAPRKEKQPAQGDGGEGSSASALAAARNPLKPAARLFSNFAPAPEQQQVLAGSFVKRGTQGRSRKELSRPLFTPNAAPLDEEGAKGAAVVAPLLEEHYPHKSAPSLRCPVLCTTF